MGHFAAARLYLDGQNRDVGLLTPATRSFQAIDQHRLLSPDGAAVLLHPLESGAEASPRFDGLVDTAARQSLLGDHKALGLKVTQAGYGLKTAVLYMACAGS